MAHDPLMRLLQRVFADCLNPENGKKEGIDLESDKNDKKEGSVEATALSRRRFLSYGGYIAAGALLPSILRGSALLPPDIAPPLLIPSLLVTDPAPRVAVIGAGMAGLNAAWQLKRRGIACTVYEASGRAGGRMYTIKDHFGPGLTTDIGGEFVDSTHRDILNLAGELGLDLYDLRTDTLIPKTFWFDGQMRGEKDLREALQPFIPQLAKDVHSLPTVISYKTADSFRRLDEQSIIDYCRSIGISGWLLNFLDVLLTREYGMEASEQSAVNFLIMFEPPADTVRHYEIFGQDHEVLKIKGGSQHLSDTLYDKVREQVLFQHSLQAIHPGEQKGYRLYFGNNANMGAGVAGPGAAPVVVEADYVIVTIPFSILRNIDMKIPVPEGKAKCIAEMGYGNSCKFIMGMNDNPWRKAGRQGYTFTDLSFGCGWDSSQLQPGQAASFTVFGGGDFAGTVKDTDDKTLAGKFIPDLNRIYPGASAAWSGKKLKYCWAGNPYSKAGYSAFRKGQWSTLAGWEALPVGNVFFAGEHVSREFQGYMNGAAQTGREAAESVAAAIMSKVPKTEQPAMNSH